MTEQQAAETTRRYARFWFRRLPHIKGSLGYLGVNDKERTQRVDTFEQVIIKLNHLLDESQDIPPEYADVIQLRTQLDGQKIPSLESIVTKAKDSRDIAAAIERTIEFGRQDFPNWADQEYHLPTIPAIGIFLEGFGYYLGTITHGVDKQNVSLTKGAFVKSFEEILIMEHPESLLLKDVVDWMKEEKTDFPASIQSKLEQN